MVIMTMTDGDYDDNNDGVKQRLRQTTTMLAMVSNGDYVGEVLQSGSCPRTLW